MSQTKTLIQEVYFDLCDLINSGQIYDIAISGFGEFETVLEFLTEQKNKLEQIESMIEEDANA